MPDYEKIAESVSVEGGIGTPEDPAEVQRKFYALDDPRYQGIAASKGYDQSYARLQKVHYSHEAMIDAIVANPNIKQNELAAQFEKSVPWISRILGSDSFQAALAKRREELTDPFLIATIEERFRGLAMQSLDIIADKLEATKNMDAALKALDLSSKALGFGARAAGGNTNTQFIIQLPPKNLNAQEWADQHTPMKQIGNG